MAEPREIARELFDLGLTAEQEARAQNLHRASIVFDLLSQHAGGNIFSHYPTELRSEFDAMLANADEGLDGLTQVEYWPYEMSKCGRSHLLRDWYEQAGLTCGTYGIEVYDRAAGPAKLEGITARYVDLPWLRYVTTAEQIRRAKADRVVAFYGNCQPLACVPEDFGAFDHAYSVGLRSFMLTYNKMNNVGVGCTERVDAGLSNFGVELVGYCNKVGMIVDVSHCGLLTTLDACRHSKFPVTANHTSAQRLSCHARGKSDEALRAIARTGGVIGVVALPAFLTAERSPSIECMLDHIDYIANLVGWRHVAIGTDAPLGAPDDVLRRMFLPVQKSIGFRDEDQLDVTKRLIGFDDCRDWPNITRGLVKRGYSDEEVRAILGENALRVFAEVCG